MNYILNKENEIYYECEWSSDHAIFLSVNDNRYIITDGRYTLDAKENAKITRGILSGEIKGPKRDAVLLNAAAALFVDGKANSIEEGIKIAAEVIDSGKAIAHLEKIVEISKKLGS